MRKGDHLRHQTTAVQWWMPWASSSLRASGSLNYWELISGRKWHSLTKLCSPPVSTTSQRRQRFPVPSQPFFLGLLILHCLRWDWQKCSVQCRMGVEGGTLWEQAQRRKTSAICYRTQGDFTVTAFSPLEKVRFQGNCSITALNIELRWEQKILLHYHLWRLHYTGLPMH